MKTNCLAGTGVFFVIIILLSCEKTSTGSNDILQSSTIEDESASFDITKDLIAWYPFSKNLVDYSNHGHNGTKVGTVRFGNDRLGNPSSALKLGSGYVVTDNFFNFQRTDSFTVTTWFKITSNPPAGRLISNECPEGNFRIASSGITSGVYAVYFGAYYIFDTITVNRWYYLTYTYKKKNVKLYRDGVLKYTGRDNGTDVITNCSPFTIGSKASSGSDFWQGAIDELRIYSRPLTAKQINYLYTH